MDNMDDNSTKRMRQPGETSAPGQLGAPSFDRRHTVQVMERANDGLADRTNRRASDSDGPKRRCISTACIACRRRKSKCDGGLPSCSTCASVYGTECVYSPNSDHRRKGVYRERLDTIKAQTSTLQVIVQAILNADEDEVFDVMNKIRTCDSLDSVAQELSRQQDVESQGNEQSGTGQISDRDPASEAIIAFLTVEGERDLAGKMGELRLENGCVRFIGGTSHLIFLEEPNESSVFVQKHHQEPRVPSEVPVTTWSRVTSDPYLINHLLDMYFSYHYPFFTTLSGKLFWRDFARGRAAHDPGETYCSPLLVNAMLALGCHFTDVPGACGTAGDSRTKGDHFFAEAKRLLIDHDEYEKPCLATVQALALMSVREAGCARETQGWVLSGMSFRMALDIGLNLEVEGRDKVHMTDEEVDARRITFWGCFLFDKCWSNYLGRLPQLPRNCFNVFKFDVFPDEDAALWSPCSDSGFDKDMAQPSRTRAVALQLSKLCEITSDLLVFFYHPSHIKKSSSKSLELKKLSDLHQRLEEWRRDLPKEFEPKEGQLPSVLLMHAFFHLQYIHLFRPFLKYHPVVSPLPPHISPRRICTANAGAISKMMRLYKKSWNLRQVCNIAVYILHSACTIHLLNLPEKAAKRDITHGLKHLEEIAEDWPCARRTLSTLSVLARKWKCELPEEAVMVLRRTDDIYERYSTSEVPSPNPSLLAVSPGMSEEEFMLWNARRVDESTMTERRIHLLDVQPAAHAFMKPGMPSTMNSALQVVLPSSDAMVRPRQCAAEESAHMVFNQNVLVEWPQAPPHPPPPPLPLNADLSPALASANGSSMAAEGLVQANVRNAASLGQGVDVDSREWILNDSARLHHNFGSWQQGSTLVLGGDGDGDGDDRVASTNPPSLLGSHGVDAFVTVPESLLYPNRDQFPLGSG